LALSIVPGDGTETLQRCGGYTYEQGELRGVVGEERRGEVRKRMDVLLQIYYNCSLLILILYRPTNKQELFNLHHSSAHTHFWCVKEALQDPAPTSCVWHRYPSMNSGCTMCTSQFYQGA
jgi:hypothetical protein